MERPHPQTPYTTAEIINYLTYIHLPHTPLPPPSLPHLTQLTRHHLSTIPFDNLRLHYSPHRTTPPSLQPSALYSKMVGTRRGGYCFELNALFGNVLRALRYNVTSRGARVHSLMSGSADERGDWYYGWTHMVNTVRLDGDGGEYLVDVGFGGVGPTRPVPLSGEVVAGVGGQELRVGGEQGGMRVYEQRVKREGEWEKVYEFSGVEFLPQDFEVVNYYVSTSAKSWFPKRLVCMKYLVEGEELVGAMILEGGVFRRRVGEEVVVLKTCEREEERVDGLKEYFEIDLSREEMDGIKGAPSELQL